jgi:hypothetical protein
LGARLEREVEWPRCAADHEIESDADQTPLAAFKFSEKVSLINRGAEILNDDLLRKSRQVIGPILLIVLLFYLLGGFR